MSLTVPPALAAEIDDLVSRYPQKRSAALMVLHAMQEHFGWISRETIEWIAARLEVAPINITELVSFYPMFRQAPAGRHHLRVCRTLSCALAGSKGLHAHLCERLALDPHAHGIQTTPDGKFSVEFVECLASCGTGPVMMVNDEFHEAVSRETADEILRRRE